MPLFTVTMKPNGSTNAISDIFSFCVARHRSM
jgi:hypothetical protein